ncbi:MAG: hypothetical protein APF76_13410 [Desulfitibacter sp. BRH_c19]|nr:MAG: hypothetical protein APF76_13410 [Desulfitibacter sp. BRH_c19]
MLIALMTRIPEPGYTKTRLESHFSKNECALLHGAFIMDMVSMLNNNGLKYKVFYDVKGNVDKLKSILPVNAPVIPQQGLNLGEKMYNALKWGFSNGYTKVGVLGTDLPTLELSFIKSARNLLDVYDLVLGPTGDGGYYFLGMKMLHKEVFNIDNWGSSTVLESTITVINKLNLKWCLLPECNDIDYFSDVIQLWKMLNENKVESIPKHTYSLLKNLNVDSRVR